MKRWMLWGIAVAAPLAAVGLLAVSAPAAEPVTAHYAPAD